MVRQPLHQQIFIQLEQVLYKERQCHKVRFVEVTPPSADEALH